MCPRGSRGGACVRATGAGKSARRALRVRRRASFARVRTYIPREFGKGGEGSVEVEPLLLDGTAILGSVVEGMPGDGRELPEVSCMRACGQSVCRYRLTYVRAFARVQHCTHT